MDKKYQTAQAVRLIFILLFVVCGGGMIAGWFMGKLSSYIGACLLITILLVAGYIIANAICKKAREKDLSALETAVLKELGYAEWRHTTNRDTFVSVKSSAAVTKYDEIKHFKEDTGRIDRAVSVMRSKEKYARAIRSFLRDNPYAGCLLYRVIEARLEDNLRYTNDYFIVVNYTSPAGKKSETRVITLSADYVDKLNSDRSLFMSKTEYNRTMKEANKALLEQKQKQYYGRVNSIIDSVNDVRDSLVSSTDKDELDKLIASLFDRTVNSIKKIKSVDSEEWALLDKVISGIDADVNKIIDKNKKILAYYNSSAFKKIKKTCEDLMASQREFNDYIDKKVQSISKMFGTAVVRNETVNNDEYEYVHPYKKSITPFTAEVSQQVFASAENSPLDYVVKIFYPNKAVYPEQIQKLHTLIEELETLKEAKQIIENYKAEVQQYITDVPAFIMENDEDGFYSRLGFATINEKTLVVEYKFAYTSAAGKAQRSFTVPMTEETIVELISRLESKLTMTAFTKEQRALMTSKLRQHIKERDNFTCRFCGNSTHKEPNLLLEVDHIIPVTKGGYTEESNLQTLCWKCNRSKSNKIL